MRDQPPTMNEAILGCLLGTAVGDAIGLPCEGLSRKRLGHVYPHIDRHHFILGRGMFSDDTEHTILIAQALIASADKSDAFTSALAWQLRIWFLGIPAGIGMATLKACAKLLVGFSPKRSGVFSAGNGPAMRSAIIGVCHGDRPAKMSELVHASTLITHTDPKAEFGALAVASAAYASSHRHQSDAFMDRLADLLGEEGDELLRLVQAAHTSAHRGQSTQLFADSIGQSSGVSGYVYATVPVALHAWFAHPKDYAAAVTSVIACGGDTDTTAAIVGAIVGAGVGKAGIPEDWLNGLAEWPRDVKWIEQLGVRLSSVLQDDAPAKPLAANPPLILLRNIVFLIVVILHGFRRLLPPY